jgi:hypothetical protein
LQFRCFFIRKRKSTCMVMINSLSSNYTFAESFVWQQVNYKAAWSLSHVDPEFSGRSRSAK